MNSEKISVFVINTRVYLTAYFIGVYYVVYFRMSAARWYDVVSLHFMISVNWVDIYDITLYVTIIYNTLYVSITVYFGHRCIFDDRKGKNDC